MAHKGQAGLPQVQEGQLCVLSCRHQKINKKERDQFFEDLSSGPTTDLQCPLRILVPLVVTKPFPVPCLPENSFKLGSPDNAQGYSEHFDPLLE